MTACIPAPLTITPAGRGKITGGLGVAIGVSRWPTDSIGNANVTFTGVHAGSEIRVYLPSGSEAAGVESCADNQTLTWQVYAAGSPNNTFRIVIVHPDYRILEFDYTAIAGNQAIPIQQRVDQWYSNP